MKIKNILLTLCSLLLVACVERRIDIDSTPTDAEVYLDGELVGNTPISIPFNYYGTREVTIRKRTADATTQKLKKHYRVFTTLITLVPPAYETFPLDFFTENIIPYQWKDIHLYNFNLQEGKNLNPEEIKGLLERSEELRKRSNKVPQSDSD